TAVGGWSPAGRQPWMRFGSPTGRLTARPVGGWESSTRRGDLPPGGPRPHAGPGRASCARPGLGPPPPPDTPAGLNLLYCSRKGMDTMRRMIATWTALGLLGVALGCKPCTHGICDCDMPDH